MADFEYTETDLQNPQGKNGHGSLGGFYYRSLYKEAIYPTVFPPPMDTWHDKFMYGRIDENQNTVFPASQNLIAIPSSPGGNTLALNVVVVAFEKFVAHMQKAVFMSAVSPQGNSALLDVKAKRAYESPGIKYSYYTQDLFNNFVNNLSGKEKFQIKDFSSFLKVYGRYLRNVAAFTPVTRSNYYLTTHTSLFSTGVSIAIANGDASNDSKKYQDFIVDPNFEFFRQCAKKFGFVVNKNAPWILTADLFSSAFVEVGMGDYVSPLGQRLDKKNFFETFYNPTFLTDIDDLIRILVNSYNQFVTKDPFYDEEGIWTTKTTISEQCKVSSKPRKILGPTAAEILSGAADAAVLPDKFLIDLYADLRQIEVESPLSALRLRTLKQEAYERYTVRPQRALSRRQNAADHINRLYKQYIYTKGAVVMQILTQKLLDKMPGGGTLSGESAEDIANDAGDIYD
jgi:hypothetical protein